MIISWIPSSYDKFIRYSQTVVDGFMIHYYNNWQYIYYDDTFFQKFPNVSWIYSVTNRNTNFYSNSNIIIIMEIFIDRSFLHIVL